MLTLSPLQPDSESTVCDDTVCTRFFTYFTRRHHCRRCGNIFCDLHSLYTIPLDQDANYHPHGTRSRACEHCWIDYRSWQLARCASRPGSEGSSQSGNDNSAADETPRTPTINCAGRAALAGVLGHKKAKGTPESLAQSVPRDWNWSTF
jgi:hypothetical protein